MNTKTYIYFPERYAPKRAPRVIHVSETWGPDLKGSESAAELADGKFQFYPARRCQIFSLSLWDACEKWESERVILEEQFDRLMKKGANNEPDGREASC